MRTGTRDEDTDALINNARKVGHNQSSALIMTNLPSIISLGFRY